MSLFKPERPVRAPGLQGYAPAVVGRVPSRGVPSVGRVPLPGDPSIVGPIPSPIVPSSRPGVPVPTQREHEFKRIPRTWRWQDGFHDHKFRTPESETRKWEYVCLNPVRAGLVKRPEEWPFGGEINYHESATPTFVPGTPPLLDKGVLIPEPEESDEIPAPKPHDRNRPHRQ